MKLPSNLLTAAALALGAASFVAPANAAPIAAPSSLHNAAASSARNRGVARRLARARLGTGRCCRRGRRRRHRRGTTLELGYGAYGYYPGYDSYAYYPGSSYGYGRLRAGLFLFAGLQRLRLFARLPRGRQRRLRTARNASVPTTRRREPIWATMAGGTRVRDAGQRLAASSGLSDASVDRSSRHTALHAPTQSCGRPEPRLRGQIRITVRKNESCAVRSNAAKGRVSGPSHYHQRGA